MELLCSSDDSDDHQDERTPLQQQAQPNEVQTSSEDYTPQPPPAGGTQHPPPIGNTQQPPPVDYTKQPTPMGYTQQPPPAGEMQQYPPYGYQPVPGVMGVQQPGVSFCHSKTCAHLMHDHSYNVYLSPICSQLKL